ncbi:MAG: hypothetical protein OER90_06850 [Gemmatimonadota bacterium]|nr:hypothetical protein [Gemmatimonadota bacterium]
MQRIDLKVILEDTASSGHGDLVTRPTGRAVRSGIEQALADAQGERVAVIDFGTVRCLDFSCADEIVGTLLREHGQAHYFLLHGVSAAHCEAIEHVLERHGLAVVARDREGRVRVLGQVPDRARREFSALTGSGLTSPEDIAGRMLAAAKRAPSSPPTADRARAGEKPGRSPTPAPE